MNTLDFTKPDERYNNIPEKVNHSWSDMQYKQEAFAKENMGNFKIVPEGVNTEIPNLIKNSHPKGLPSTRNWYRRVSTFERNGIFNAQTHIFNTKFGYWSVPLVIGFGYINFVLEGWHYEHYEDREYSFNLYEKLANRLIPFARVWTRPG